MSGPRTGGLSRRDFLWQAVAGVASGAAMFGGAWSLAGLPRPPRPYLPRASGPLQTWEVDYGVIDYDVVPAETYGPPELGFSMDIRRSPLDARVLDVAQWYDYWPGTVVREFGTWMQATWNVSGASVRWTPNIYTSNESLLDWIRAGRRFDLMFPTNHAVETLEKAGYLANLNLDWIPNYANVLGRVPASFPAGFATTRPEFGYVDDRGQWAPTASTYPGLTDEYGNGSNNHAAADFRDPDANGYAYRGSASAYPDPKPHPEGTAW
ncbi:MAG: hypothetical protein ACT4OI_10575, partial [Methanobacteriota archaeon]